MNADTDFLSSKDKSVQNCQSFRIFTKGLVHWAIKKPQKRWYRDAYRLHWKSTKLPSLMLNQIQHCVCSWFELIIDHSAENNRRQRRQKSIAIRPFGFLIFWWIESFCKDSKLNHLTFSTFKGQVDNSRNTFPALRCISPKP